MQIISYTIITNQIYFKLRIFLVEEKIRKVPELKSRSRPSLEGWYEVKTIFNLQNLLTSFRPIISTWSQYFTNKRFNMDLLNATPGKPLRLRVSKIQNQIILGWVPQLTQNLRWEHCLFGLAWEASNFSHHRT